MQAGDHTFSCDSLKEEGLQNHVNVGGWREKSLASRIPPMNNGSEHPYSHFLVCFLYSPLSHQCWGGGEGGEGGEEALGRVRETQVWPDSSQPSMRLPTVSCPGMGNYLCLQIAFDSHELFFLPANRSGDGRELLSQQLRNPGAMAEGALTRKSRALGFGPSSVTAMPLLSLARPRAAHLQNERAG